MKVFYIYGPPAVGKSYYAHKQLKEAEVTGEKVIVLDDVRKDFWSLDEYDCDKLIITSNHSPHDDIKDKIDETWHWQ